MLLSCFSAFGQNNRRRARSNRGANTEVVLPNSDLEGLKLEKLDSAGRARLDSTNRAKQAKLDSIAFVKDSTARADSLFRADSLEMLSKSSLELPAFTGAKDSIVEVFSNGQKKIYYYGDVTVTYQGMKLTADVMEYDMNTGIVNARGTLDTLTGQWKGLPVMEQGQAKYEMEKLKYNFNTQKAFITNMTTNEQEGILHGQNIKMMPDRTINVSKGRYTVCDAEEPHYYMKMTSAKVIPGKDGNTIIFGPANLVVGDVSIPFIGLPFGFVPKKPQRATGLLMPTFGEEATRGFYMRDAGVYLVLGDYFDLSLTGDLYTLGSWAVDVNSRYKVNYKFNGNFAFTYSNDQGGIKDTPSFFQSSNFSLKWSHTQDSKARPGTSFSASVNFSSPGNNKYNAHSVNEALQNQISSSVSFSKNWAGKVNLSVNALHSQNSRDSSYTFTLPNVTLSVSTFYPFKQKNRVGKEKLYEKISFGYNTSLQNKINFKASEFGKDGFTDKFKNGMSHNFSIGLPSFSLFKYINVSPSVSYGMNWFFRKSEAQLDEESGKPILVEGKQFSTFGITQNTSASASVSTRLYGMYNFGKYSKIQAIRHVVSPSISLSYMPDLSKVNGWREMTYLDKNGKENVYSYNIYQGQLLSAPGKGQTASMSFTLGNNFEAKVRDLADTTGKGSKKVKLLDQLNFSTGYNFLAPEFKMNTIGATMSTTLFQKMNISANANLDPYAIDETGKKVNRFQIVENWRKPLRLTNASASLSYALNGEGKLEGMDDAAAMSSSGGSGGSAGGHGGPTYNRIYYHPITGEYIPGGWLYYTNPAAPWSLNFSYTFSYSKNYSNANNQLQVKHNFTQTVSLNGNIKLSPRLSLNGNTGFDLMAMKLTTSQISATYDLHCFNISVSWVPTGQWKSYSFRFAANAAALADLLKFKKSSSYWDN